MTEPESRGSNPWRREAGVSRFVTPDEAREWLRSQGRPPTLDDPYVSAVHEAGHAVATLLLGGIVKMIDVRLEILTVPGLGEMLGSGYQEGGWPVRETPQGLEPAEGVPERKLVAWAAGVAAEQLIFGPDGLDGKIRMEIGQAPQPVTDANAAAVVRVAAALLRPHRARVEALAQALVRRGVIEGSEEIQRIAGR